ncbi:Nad-binding protein [Lasiodiplodia theobromae]|uniref:Nad-binding protein n=1 Tax=Lasiodiplodia theobromae TaxID=45133 RepID=UPI0015C30780|nr:Nad-binding protein [Lasiodiplodia theobromae]KAF4535004.1 Nad-binding protein [Lasiodiplodia theobromae]
MESTTSENADENTDENPSFAQQRKDTKPKEGLWEKQMFVDQSLRSMAAFMVALATIMVVSCISLAPKLSKGDLRTTSIPIVSGSQGDMNAICEVTLPQTF